MKIYFCLLFIMITPIIVQADEIYLKDDSLIKCRIVRVDSNEVEIEGENGNSLIVKERPPVIKYLKTDSGIKSVVIKREEVRRLVYSDSTEVKVSSDRNDDEVVNGIYNSKTAGSNDDSTKKNLKGLVSAGIKKMSGNTTYQIGGKIDTPEGNDKFHFPISELEFPLNVYLFSVDGTVDFYSDFEAGFNFNKSMTSDAGTMKDSDWGVPFEYPYLGSGDYGWYGPNHKDIYSESDSKLDAMIVDIKVLYKVINFKSGDSHNKTSILIGLGYLYQSFNFECVLIHQWDLRPEVPADQNMDFKGDGSVGITYSVKSSIPYMNVGIRAELGRNFIVDAGFGYSPLVKVKDRDNHVYRSKISKADCHGSAMLFSADINYFIHKPVFIKFGIDYLSVNTEGWEKQYIEGEYWGKIEQKNFCRRVNYGIAIGGEILI